MPRLLHAVVERPARLAASGRRGRLVRHRRSRDRLRPARGDVVGGRQPARCSPRRGASSTTRRQGSSSPPRRQPARRNVGSARGELDQVPGPASFDGGGEKCFVCLCEDVTVKDARRAVAEGRPRPGEGQHDDDDGAVPGEALPARLDQADGTHDRDRRVGDRHDDRPPALAARRAGAARRPTPRTHEALTAPLPRPGGRRADRVGRPVAEVVSPARGWRRGATGARRSTSRRSISSSRAWTPRSCSSLYLEIVGRRASR